MKDVFLPLDIQFFAEELTSDNPSEIEQAEPTAEEPDKLPNQTAESTKTFTQEELDEIIAKRLERERKKYVDYEEKAKRLEELEKAEEERKKAEMDELERLRAEKEEAERLAQEKEESAKKAMQAAQEKVLNAEIRSIARALNANDADDVLALLDKSTLVDEEGNIAGVEQAVKALKEKKPWMFKAPIGADAVGGSNPAKNPTVDEISQKEKELEELKQRAVTNPRLLGKVTKLANEILKLKNK